MKKYMILSIVLLISFSSCKKSWLDIVPLGSKVAETTDDFDKIMNDPAFYNSEFSGGWTEAQLMGDEVAAEGAYFANRGENDLRSRFFEWRADIYPNSTKIPYALNKHLSQLYQINKVVNEVLNSTGGTTARKLEIRAEALATRAWSNFIMANYYCKPYVAATASSDPGFPIIKIADINIRSYPRGTVQEIYDFIIQDLKESLENINKKPALVTRWSKPAVEGFLGKVYLFMGKPDEALPLLKAALADVAANGQTALYNYNQTLQAGGKFLPIDEYRGPVNGPGNLVNDLQEAVVSKVFYSGTYNGNFTGNEGLVLTDEAKVLYGANDLRLSFYTNTNLDNTLNAAGRLRKYGVTFSRWGLQLPELYLLAAEAKARTNDLAGAVSDLQTLRSNRIQAVDADGNAINDAMVPAAAASNRVALIQFIMEERIREFAVEGYRWFDMRRLAVDPLFPNLAFKHTLYNADGSITTYTLKLPERLVMQLPPNIVEGDPGLINNP
ncbi:putative lipoprotein [Pedobacter sp. BAL39]|uniref:RagB/SusD family nutrient uptake outer membrane protein n=1 Tax=Pedobacter sp. BAL39 TaxID=391596 RepID=UPI00015597AF|nr:RagB/SusD family nutrient uptake outer membrane protein [Pedobacter sp. BAL39]EDM38907.1 putative lipoprotein [Pedobacter sp. BAL39]